MEPIIKEFALEQYCYGCPFYDEKDCKCKCDFNEEEEYHASWCYQEEEE